MSTATEPGRKRALGRGIGSLLGEHVSAMPEETRGPAAERVSRRSEEPKSPQPDPQRSADAPLAAPTPVPHPIDETRQIWSMAIEKLTPNTHQPRSTFEPEALKELSDSIRSQGIIQPILARRLSDQTYEIIAGERRWRAAQLAGLKEVPVILRKAETQESFELAILENVQRSDLNPIEEAEAYQRLANEFGYTQQRIAERLGKERSSVANALRLLELPPEVRLMVKARELSPGHAKVILSLQDSAARVELAQQVVREKLSVRVTEKLVAQANLAAKATETDGAKADGSRTSSTDLDVRTRLVKDLAVEVQKILGTKVAIDYERGRGKMQIHFYTDDQLTSIIERLRRQQ